MSLFSEIFCWWGGNTWGTRLFTWRKGKFVGEDQSGNRYFVQRSGVGPLGVPARWVIYPKLSEASQVPPEWHGWLHYTTAEPIPASARQPWQVPHQPNLTGTPGSYRPPGHDYRGGHRPPATGDYESWTPGS